MHYFRPRVAVALVGCCAFMDLYSPQALLPMLAREFNAGVTDVGLLISATSFAVALIAPFSGTVADVLGRKRVIASAMFVLVVPMTLIALAADLHAMIFWRFMQGLLLPPIFAVTIAYISEEFSGTEAVTVTGIFTSGSSIGGFLGRFLTGVLTEAFGWRTAFMILAALTLLCAAGVVVLLPREQRFVRAENLRRSFRQMLRHLRNRRLLGTFGIGFSVLFSFVAIFTYVNFRLAAPPFNLSSAALGAIFVTYLLGAAVTPWIGHAVQRLGRRAIAFVTVVIWAAGLLLTLAPPLIAIIIGLALAAACGITYQTMSTSFVAQTAGEGRSAAVGLYVTSFYLGGSVGGVLPGLTWTYAGYPGAVGMVLVILLFVTLMAGLYWPPKPR
ncbi:MAG TPA: MFS transporter [Alphaproteobacteria bacterium]|nr:MFS transporter [Alphaproteobacteria bacterium]